MNPKHLFILICLIGGFPPVAWAQPDSPAFSSIAGQTQSQPAVLSIAEAFPFFVSDVSPGRYRVTWQPAPGHYLYRHAFQFTLRLSEDGDELPVEVTLPDGIRKTDQFFGPIEAYYNRVSAELSLSTVPGPDAVLLIHYQGCADWGFCYPPQQAPYRLIPESGP